MALRNRFLKGAERWATHARDLKPLKPGMKVILQNQHGAGKIAKKWDRTGLIIDDLGHNKYRIKVDGSGRVTDRNRQFLRQFTPATPSQPGPRPGTTGNSHYPEPVVTPVPDPEQTPPAVIDEPDPVVQPIPQTPDRPVPGPVVQPTPQTPESPTFTTPPTSPIADIPRRSTRVSRPPDRWGYDKF